MKIENHSTDSYHEIFSLIKKYNTWNEFLSVKGKEYGFGMFFDEPLKEDVTLEKEPFYYSRTSLEAPSGTSRLPSEIAIVPIPSRSRAFTLLAFQISLLRILPENTELCTEWGDTFLAITFLPSVIYFRDTDSKIYHLGINLFLNGSGIGKPPYVRQTRIDKFAHWGNTESKNSHHLEKGSIIFCDSIQA
jgi:hypothetical protein